MIVTTITTTNKKHNNSDYLSICQNIVMSVFLTSEVTYDPAYMSNSIVLTVYI